MRFETSFKYSDRSSKAQYVWAKYHEILSDASVLDVGSDACYLRDYLPDPSRYMGIGLGTGPDMVVDLEKGAVPFVDNGFDVVLCLDVLEHLDNPHDVFDELARVTRSYLLISLPNPWSTFIKTLRRGRFSDTESMKFYGLPPEPPVDRHKWFFSATEARDFVVHRAAVNDLAVVQMDYESLPRSRTRSKYSLRGRLGELAWRHLFRGDISDIALFSGPLWAVLRKPRSS